MLLSPWTEAATARLKQLWAEGYSAGQIARDMGGVSRNAVIGKAARMKLPARKTGNQPQRQPRHVMQRATKRQRVEACRETQRVRALRAFAKSAHLAKTIERAGGVENWIKEKLKAPPTPRPYQPTPAPETAHLPPVVARVTFADLEAHHCRMPAGDPLEPGFGFCGQAPVPGQPYCPDCCQRAYRPPQVRRQAEPFRQPARSIVSSPLEWA